MSVLPLVKMAETWALQVQFHTSLTTRELSYLTGEDADAVFEQLLEADVDVDDVEAERKGSITVYTAPTDLHKAIVALRESGYRRIPSY